VKARIYWICKLAELVSSLSDKRLAVGRRPCGLAAEFFFPGEKKCVAELQWKEFSAWRIGPKEDWRAIHFQWPAFGFRDPL